MSQAEKNGKNTPENKPSARETALEIVYQVLEKGAFANLQLEKILSSRSFSPEDRKLITEIVNETVRMRLYLDWVLAHFVKKGLYRLNPWVRNILRISACQILFMERIPDHAAVSEAVRLTRRKASEGLTGLCNGVLRSLLRQKEQLEAELETMPDSTRKTSIRYSLPEWMVMELEKTIPQADQTAVFEYLNTPGRMELRINSLKTTVQALTEELQQKNIQVRPSDIVPNALEVLDSGGGLTGTPAFREGKFYIQNSASQLAAYIVDPKPGERILDLCCGVGGKSTHLAEKSGDLADITAVELYAHKLQILLENCERLGIHSVRPLRADISEGLPSYRLQADRVVLDAPCSGWGVLNRRADIRWKQDEKQLQALQTLQQELLQQAAQLVKPGGILVYITCTLRPEENEENIAAFLTAHPEYHAEAFAEEIAFFPLKAEDRKQAQRGMLRILPGIYGTDGMFYAKLRKEGSSGAGNETS